MTETRFMQMGQAVMGQLPNGTLNQLSSNYKSHVSRIGLKSKFIFSLISSLITDNDFIVIDRILV